MRISKSIIAAGIIAVAGSARAEASLIPSNYVDDFGTAPDAVSETTAKPRAGHPIAKSDPDHEQAGSGGGARQRGGAKRDAEKQFLQGIWSAP